MQTLKSQLEKLINTLSATDRDKVKNRLDDLISVYPFNEYEYIISSLLALDKITLDDYLEIRDEYVARNMFLYIFEISAPRGFGEQWAQGHLKELAPELIKPTKKIEENYSGQYDFLYQMPNKEMIKIEVKASRAVDFDSQEPLYVKALEWGSKKHFDMNFQQVKPKCCDVFVWIGVWRDTIKYWILASKEVESNKFYSKGQHRGNTGEGQIHLKHDNMQGFVKYEALPKELLEKIVEAYNRQNSNKLI
ncbi:hypothetical protein CO005_03385 [Candidatus Roizmanbacteria bacterium CG_4_8_14_3_um_filter_34_9]|uniref:Restriction endonuclease subunit M n=2 Tax=cellular organisms TaxID=131567 RepID=A0A2H9M8G5_HUBC1|nr:hypothetical protein [archaeon]PIV46367.1 MAG: hypothetical protein COS22_01780 [Candidatus Huberarchaeum crystalense]PIW73081.1 MAG: hypothetical protein CO005_03385 [Candidatus Roizmanbacteria bacterium CG_4_8_14_3_um_filter_34_9]